ncbi:MAG: LPS-assembly protein [Pseudohongiellaceae bacterium]|jgi:LPS-assembly protein
MPLTKRRLSTDIAFVVASGFLLSAIPKTASAQLEKFNCRANISGDGWVCENISPDSVVVAPRRSPAYRPEPQTKPPEAVLDPGDTNESAEPLPISAPSTPQLAPASPTPPAISDFDSNHPLDWIPRAELTSEQLASLPPNCCGAFIDPNLLSKAEGIDPANAPIEFRAANGMQQISQSLINLSGDVVVQQGYRTVQNDRATSVNRAENTIVMQGNVEFREPGILIVGDSAFIDTANNSNKIESAQYVIHDFGAHGTAASMVYSSDSGLVVIENGEFSRCEPENSFWKLSAQSIVLDQNANRGYAKAVSLRIRDFPIFYYPFTLPFPLNDESVSGFLPPSMGSTRTGGLDIELPYYLKLAPNYDATISPRLLSDRGVMFNGEARYLSSSTENALNLSYLGGDDLFDAATADSLGSPSPPVADRWFVGYKHQGAFGQNWSTFVDYNAVSDDDYFFDLGANGLNVFSRSNLNRQGQLNFNSDYLRAGINLQRIQIIDPFANAVSINTPYDRLPQIHFETGSYLPAGFRLGLRGEATAFDRNLDDASLSLTQLDNGALVTGQRLNLEPEVNWSVETPGWFLRANGKYKLAEYRLENQAFNTMEDPGYAVGIVNADAGLIFERSFGNGSRTQTLEPRIYYLYSEFEDQSMLPLFDTSELNFSFNQLFRDDRFTGGDRVGDADQLTAALTTRILDAKGRERLRASIGQITYFEDRQVSLANPLIDFIPRYSPTANTSAFVGEFGLSLGANWQLNTDVQYSEDRQDVDEGSFQLRYQADNDHLLNFSYRFRSLVNTPTFTLPGGIDPRIKQTDFSGVWPISANWKVLGRWNYDHSNSRVLETFAGVEWSNCCAIIRVIGREWVDVDELFVPNIEPNQGIFVQVTLNGLGNLTGGGLSNLLSDGIWGFRDTQYDQ